MTYNVILLVVLQIKLVYFFISSIFFYLYSHLWRYWEVITNDFKFLFFLFIDINFHLFYLLLNLLFEAYITKTLLISHLLKWEWLIFIIFMPFITISFQEKIFRPKVEISKPSLEQWRTLMIFYCNFLWIVKAYKI